MIKKFAILILLGAFLLLSGCETAAGVTKGLAGGIHSTAEGVGKDSWNLFQAMKAADNWMRKNLW